MNIDVTINPTLDAMSIFSATELNNEALQAERNGDLVNAERLHLEALAIKEQHIGANAVTTALTRNALGELYMKLNRLDDAELNLKKAIEIRSSAGPPFDAAVSRENLAQLMEMRGDMKTAGETRLLGSPDNMVCGHYRCSGQLFKKEQLRQCSKCKSIYYCSPFCQDKDWGSRHKALCKAS